MTIASRARADLAGTASRLSNVRGSFRHAQTDQLARGTTAALLGIAILGMVPLKKLMSHKS